MKIGILTYHRSHNFGALAQAIALRETLVSMGNEVVFINYWPDYHKAMYALFSVNDFFRQPSLREKWRYIKRKWREYPAKRISYRKYIHFIEDNILPYSKGDIFKYDCIIYGSDQIWRKQPWIHTFNPVYFADNTYMTKKNIAYSASMGITELDNSDKEYLKSLLSNFDQIAVRESELQSIVEELGFSCIITVDPALLLNKERWNQIFPITNIKKERGYVLFVNYIKDSFDEHIIRQYATEKNLEFVKVNGSVMGKDTPDAMTDVGPDELVDLIRNADVVFTSSFHAMIFSIVYQKEFFAGFRNNSSRAESILCSLSIRKRLIKEIDLTELLSMGNIDYIDVNEKLDELVLPSLNYLKESLK